MAKRLSERKEAWFKLVVLIITGIILYVWGWIVGIITIVHWLIVVFSGKRSKSLAEFCEPWNTETYKFYRYLTGVSYTRPFPFTSTEKMSKFEK